MIRNTVIHRIGSFSLLALFAAAICMPAAASERNQVREVRDTATPRAQSAAAAATGARDYTAQLRRCETLDTGRKANCVETARRKLD